ncbi:MAG: lipoate--protein ligase family protein [Clostridia bacterium]|nr:lipoate--protein ligase family protein [Clostridia bacterium]
MINKLITYISQTTNAYINQASEAYFLESVKEGELILYFWANKNAIFIGRNQDAFSEVAVDAFLKDGGSILRRFSGGGAVYHDIGNINFSIITTEKDYDLALFRSLLLKAFKMLGIDAKLSGRNDFEVNGLKFSGNAYLKRPVNGVVKCLQHGTILVSLYPDAVSKYLTPSKAKLERKGVKSVESRVTCLCEINKDITIEGIIQRIKEEFVSQYGESEDHTLENVYSENVYKDLYMQLISKKWIYGEYKLNDNCFESVIKNSKVDIELCVKDDIIINTNIYTDDMDVCFIQSIKDELEGVNINDIDSLTTDSKKIVEDYIRWKNTI